MRLRFPLRVHLVPLSLEGFLCFTRLQRSLPLFLAPWGGHWNILQQMQNILLLFGILHRRLWAVLSTLFIWGLFLFFFRGLVMFV